MERATLAQLTWFDRQGRPTSTVAERAPYTPVVLPRRGRRATLVRADSQATEENADLWDVDLGIVSRLTTDPARDSDPSWSPDERRVAFTSFRLGRSAIFVKDVNSG